MTGRARGRDAERGTGTVLALMIVLAVLAATMVAATLASGVTARRAAASAADQSALAAASELGRGGVDPCAAAAAVAQANGATLAVCEFSGPDIEVEVIVAVGWNPFGLLPDGRRRARAGPSM